MSTPFYFVFATYEEAKEAQPSFESVEAEVLRLQAADCSRRSRESFDRCDTDGFLSQWANDITAAERLREAELCNAGFTVVRPVLMDIESGEIVAACAWILPSKFHYGSDHVWKVYRNGGVEWVNAAKRESTYNKKGLKTVYVLAPAAMAGYIPGDRREAKRGLGGCADYTGKAITIDYQASGLPL